MLNNFTDGMAPLYAACAQIWLHGTQDAIDTANELLSACADMLATLTADDPKRPLLLALIIGEGWSNEQQRVYDDALRRVSEARLAFINVARAELGNRALQLARGSSQAAEKALEEKV